MKRCKSLKKFILKKSPTLKQKYRLYIPSFDFPLDKYIKFLFFIKGPNRCIFKMEKEIAISLNTFNIVFIGLNCHWWIQLLDCAIWVILQCSVERLLRSYSSWSLFYENVELECLPFHCQITIASDSFDS